MLPYFLFFLFIFLCYFCDVAINRKRNIFKVLVFIGLTLFAGLRRDVGVDYSSYVYIYDGGLGSTIKEQGTLLIMAFLRSIGGTSQLYFLTMSVVTEFFVYKILICYKKYFWLLVVIYYCASIFYFASFNAVRNSVAIAIIVWSLKYIESEKFLAFFVVVLFTGVVFHYSSLIFIPLFFYLNKEQSIRTILLVGIILLLASGLIFKLLEYSPYAGYIKFLDNDVRENKVELIHYLFAVISLIIILIGKRFKDLNQNIVVYNMNVLSFYTILLVIHQSSGSFVMLFQRLNNYFIFSYLMIIPLMLSSMRKNTAYIMKVGLLVFSICYIARTVILNGERYMLVPYNFSFQLFE